MDKSMVNVSYIPLLRVAGFIWLLSKLDNSESWSSLSILSLLVGCRATHSARALNFLEDDMKSISFHHKISLLIAIQIILFCLSSFAAGTVIDQRSLHDYSLLDGGYTQRLSLDGAQLLAMADDTRTTASRSEQFDLSEGIFSESNRHIILGTLGAALLTLAVVMAANDDESSHSGLGISGGVLMALGIIDIKW
jgi:hypothetical protein